MTCPFCGLDPYERVDVGIGSIIVAITCCEDYDRLYHGEDFQYLATAWMAGARATLERYENALRKIAWNRDDLDAAALRQIADEALNGPPITEDPECFCAHGFAIFCPEGCN